MDGCEAVGADASGHVFLGDVTSERAASAIELIRTTTAGILDEAWNGDGHATVRRTGLAIRFAPDTTQIRALGPATSPIFAMPDGSVLVAASVRSWPDGQAAAGVIKLTPSGDLDTTFGDDGIGEVVPSGGSSRIVAMAVDRQGRAILSAIFTRPGGITRGYLVRLTADGLPDESFGADGLIEQIHTASSIAVDEEGRILTAAWAGRTGDVIVARRNG
jgi:uncharacterized delta-60 repeat protein